MSNREVAAAFAHGRLASGSNFYTEHVESSPGRRYTVLISYSTPVAYRCPAGVAYFDARSYSVTTSKQVNYAKQAVDNAVMVPHAQFRDDCRKLGIYLGGAR